MVRTERAGCTVLYPVVRVDGKLKRLQCSGYGPKRDGSHQKRREKNFIQRWRQQQEKKLKHVSFSSPVIQQSKRCNRKSNRRKWQQQQQQEQKEQISLLLNQEHKLLGKQTNGRYAVQCVFW